jgi:hypothetical protein
MRRHLFFNLEMLSCENMYLCIYISLEVFRSLALGMPGNA